MFIFNLRMRRIVLAVLLLFFCGASSAGGRIHVIPEPVSVTEKPGSFYLRQGATLAVEGDSTAGISAWLVGRVREQTGVLLREEKGARGAIVVVVGEKYRGKGAEGYRLGVSSSGVRIEAEVRKGPFTGCRRCYNCCRWAGAIICRYRASRSWIRRGSPGAG